MKLSIFGTGYVGLVTAASFAEMGNTVIGVDVDTSKIERLSKGQSPIYEPGLELLLQSNLKANRIRFSIDGKKAIEETDVIFIAVGTPPQADGSADMQHVFAVADLIASQMTQHKTIVTKSTVPVGTYRKIKERLQLGLKKRGLNITFDLASNPEFLREGCAVEDSLKPSRVIVGVESEPAKTLLAELYNPFLRNGNPFLTMDPASAEMAKYAANCMLATRISLMNEFSRLCEKLGADIESVRKGVGSDPRIGSQFIYAGLGYGGSCFPKDVSAVIHAGQEQSEQMLMLEAVKATNELQRNSFLHRIIKRFPNLQGKKLAIWGVAFKPGTDDVREAPAMSIIEGLIKKGAKILAYDPIAAKNAQLALANSKENLEFVNDQYQVLEGAEALIICTEWQSFYEPDFDVMLQKLKNPVIFDGRNIYSPKIMFTKKVEYHSVGR